MKILTNYKNLQYFMITKQLTYQQTQWELFKQLMISFDLKNESNTFQHYINDKFHDFLNVFVIAYIDNILIYLFTLSEYWRHVWMILKQLWEADLQCDIKKCKFHVTEIMYLDLIIFHNDIKMNSVKIKAIIDWKSS